MLDNKKLLAFLTTYFKQHAIVSLSIAILFPID